MECGGYSLVGGIVECGGYSLVVGGIDMECDCLWF